MNLEPEDLQAIAAEVAKLLDESSDLNWGEVGLEGENQRINQSALISAKDHAQLKVASLLQGKSIAQTVQTAVITYLRRNWKEHLKLLDVVSAREGISREEAFIKVHSEELKP
jgi:hypothetical protein